MQPPSKGQPMTDTTEARAAMKPDIVEAVAQEDREAAKLHQHRFLTEGRSETELLWEAFARHRIASVAAARAAHFEEAAEIAYDAITDGELAREVATAIRAAGVK